MNKNNMYLQWQAPPDSNTTPFVKSNVLILGKEKAVTKNL
jgi:hypothetical protein